MRFLVPVTKHLILATIFEKYGIISDITFVHSLP